MGDKPEVSEYGSVDPAPASDEINFETMKSILLDDSARMFERMRVVFKFRNIRDSQSCIALCQAFSTKSALLRHELAYVLGQMQMDEAIPTLIDRLSDINEHVISNSCEECPPGKTNEGGDDSSGDGTECDSTLCSENEYVFSNKYICEIVCDGRFARIQKI